MRLKGLEQEQAIAIRQRFSSIPAMFSTFFSLFPKSNAVEKIGGGGSGIDIIQLVSSFVLPFTLNKTLFKRSNFLVKAIVRLASQKASQYISTKNLGFIWDKVKSIIPEKEKKVAPGPAYNSLPHME
jgi:hypothetical protein